MLILPANGAFARILAAGTLLSATACMVGPDYEPPELSVAENWTHEADARVDVKPSEHREWWQTFNDETLKALIEKAHEQNLPLRMAGLRILEARAQLGRAVGFLYPQAQGGFGAISRLRISEGGNLDPTSNLPVSVGLGGTFDNYQIGAGAVWEIDLWGQFRRGVEAADAMYIATVANYDDMLVSLTAEVATAYITIRTLDVRLALTNENVSLQEQSLEMAESRFRNGATSELDVTQATTLLAQTRALVPALEVARRQAINGLGILLGTSGTEIMQLLGGVGTIPTAPADVAVGLPADLLRRRPDLRLRRRASSRNRP